MLSNTEVVTVSSNFDESWRQLQDDSAWSLNFLWKFCSGRALLVVLDDVGSLVPSPTSHRSKFNNAEIVSCCKLELLLTNETNRCTGMSIMWWCDPAGMKNSPMSRKGVHKTFMMSISMNKMFISLFSNVHLDWLMSSYKLFFLIFRKHAVRRFLLWYQISIWLLHVQLWSKN